VGNPGDHGCCSADSWGENLVIFGAEMAEQRNPVEMTEEEIAEASGELLRDRRATSAVREAEPLPQPIGIDAAPSASSEDSPPAS